MSDRAVIGLDASRAVTSQRTGTEGYAYFFIKALLELGQGVDFRLYVNQQPSEGLFPAGTNIQIVHIPAGRLWSHSRLAWELHRRPPDIFFTPAHVIPFTYSGRSLATVHDLGYHYFPQAHTRFQIAYLRWSTAHNARRSQTVLADSTATKQDLSRWYAISPNKIKVVYPGRDPHLQPITNPRQLLAVQQKYGLQPPYLLYLGTLQPRKNLGRLIQAYAQSGLPHQLVLAGKVGWLAQPILAQIAALPLPIHLPGFVADEDKAALISGAAALLYPSLYEGFGFPILEGQACGVPVLTANNSSLPEVAGEGALLVAAEDTPALTDALRQIVLDEGLRQRLVPAGYANLQRFSWEKAAKQLLQIMNGN